MILVVPQHISFLPSVVDFSETLKKGHFQKKRRILRSSKKSTLAGGGLKRKYCPQSCKIDVLHRFQGDVSQKNVSPSFSENH